MSDDPEVIEVEVGEERTILGVPVRFELAGTYLVHRSLTTKGLTVTDRQQVHVVRLPEPVVQVNVTMLRAAQ